MSVEVLASADFRACGLLSNLLGNPYPKAAIAGCEELAICYHPKPDKDLFILSMYKLAFGTETDFLNATERFGIIHRHVFLHILARVCLGAGVCIVAMHQSSSIPGF